MKENPIFSRPEGLTSQAQTAYSRAGGSFMAEPGGGENPPKPTEPSSEQKPTQPSGQKGWFRKTVVGLGKIVGGGVGEVQGRTQHPHEVAKPIEPTAGQPPAQELPKEPVQQEPEAPKEVVGEKPKSAPGTDSAEIKDEKIKELVTTYGVLIAAEGKTSESLRKLWDKVEQLVDVNQAEKSRVLMQIAEAIRLAKESEEQERRKRDIEENRRMSEQYRRREEKEIIGTIRRDDGRELSLREMLINREKRDEVFNDIFAAVDATPHEFFERAFNPLTYGRRFEMFMETILNASIGRFPEGVDFDAVVIGDLKNELKEDFLRYQAQRRVRQILHDMNAVLYRPSVKGEEFYGFIQQFGSELGDFAHRLPGVRDMMNLYEINLREDMRENGGYLRPEAVLGKIDIKSTDDGKKVYIKTGVGEVEENTKKQFKRFLEKGLIFTRDTKGNAVPIEREGFKDWEIDRIFTIGRGMMIATERLISLAAESRLPKGGEFTSLFLQDLLQSYSPYVHLLGKYGISESGLAAYLYESDQDKIFGIFKRPWSAVKLKKTLKQLKEEKTLILDGAIGETFYLKRRNPNRAGDLYTWLSWRAGETAEAVSMTKDFIEKGKNRMKARFEEKGLTPSEEQLNEYGKWIGTGLRFERLRGSLANLDNLEQRLKSNEEETRDKAKKALDAKKKAPQLIQRIVDLQPARLYLASKTIQDSVQEEIKNAGYTKEQINKILENLTLAEAKLFQSREQILDGELKDKAKGDSFDTVKLEGFLSDATTDATELEQAKRFMEIISNDYSAKKDRYWKEFVTNREYEHGFVLWSGDAPVDEFNIAALGPTGGPARRARDNDGQSKAAQAEIKLLTSLKNVKTPEEVVELLLPVYEGIASYDADKAKDAITEKAEGIAKFFGGDWATKIGLPGEILKLLGRGSFAQVAYGRTATVWNAGQKRHLFNHLRAKGMLTQEQYDGLVEKTDATKRDVVGETTILFAQLIAIAIIFYLLEKTAKEK